MNFTKIDNNQPIATSEVALVRDDVNGYSIALRVNGQGYLVALKDLVEEIQGAEAK